MAVIVSVVFFIFCVILVFVKVGFVKFTFVSHYQPVPRPNRVPYDHRTYRRK